MARELGMNPAKFGKLDNHKSHQTGLDVDVGFYFRSVPAGYPDHFAGAEPLGFSASSTAPSVTGSATSTRASPSSRASVRRCVWN